MSHAADFMALPDTPRLTLANLTAPSCLVGASGSLAPFEITIEGGRIAAGTAGERVDMRGALVFPAFVDLHTHLDKSQIWSRAPNPDGTSDSAPAGGRRRPHRPLVRGGRAPPDGVRASLRLRARHAGDPHPPRLLSPPARDLLRRLPGAAGRLGGADRAPGGKPLQRRRARGRGGVRGDRGRGGRLGRRPRLHRHAASGASSPARRPPRDGRKARNGGGPACGRDRRSRLRQPARRRRVRARDRVRRPGHRRPLLLARGSGGGRGARHPRPRCESRHQRGEPPDVQPVPPGPGGRPERRAGAGSPSCTR